MKPISISLALVGVLALLPSCSSKIDPLPPKSTHDESLGLRDIDWNLTKADVGQVSAIVEVEGETVFFGSHGATILQGGAISSTVAGVSEWSAATPIPAADGVGTWIVGVTSDGKLLRLRATGVFEDVTARYGLDKDHVRAMIALDTAVVFAVSSGIAIADGKTVTHYDAAAGTTPAGGNGRLAWTEKGEVRTLDVKTKTLARYPLTGAAFVTIDHDGNLVAATARAIYVEKEGALHLAYTSPDADVGALVAAGTRVWVRLGAELGALEAGILHRTKDLELPATTRLVPAMNGDVWTLSPAGLHRYGRDPADLARLDWETTMLPIFAKVCSNCHQPGGTANVDLSTYQGWLDYRGEIRKRVIDQRSMPPKSQTFAESDRDAVKAWLDRAP